MAKRSYEPLAAVRHGRAMQSLGTGPCGDCRRVLWVPGPRGQYSGKIRFIKKPGVQDQGVASCLNVVLPAPSSGTPLESRAKFLDGTVWVFGKGTVGTGPAGSVFGVNSFYRETWGTRRIATCLNVVLTPPHRHGRARKSSGTGPCGDCRMSLWVPGPRGHYLGEIRFIEEPGVQDEGVKCSFDPTSNGTPRESQANFRDGTVLGLLKGPVGTGPAGSVFWENSFYREI